MARSFAELPVSPIQLEDGQFQAPGQILANHEPEQEQGSRPGTPKFWRISGFVLSPHRGGFGGGSGAAAAVGVLAPAPAPHERLEATGRPLSRQSSLTTELQQAAQQQPMSPRLAVKTPRAPGGGGSKRPRTPGRCSSALALHIYAPGGGPVRDAAGGACSLLPVGRLAAGDGEHGLPFIRHRSFSLPVPV